MDTFHNNNEHKFVPVTANHPYYCGRCDQLGFGSSYTCYKYECNLYHHKECHDPTKYLEYPFSTKCVLRFRSSGSGKDNCLCNVCGKTVKGYHYKCMCNFTIRYVHPSCLSHEQTIVAVEGLTLHLKKEATTKCLHCDTKNLCSKVCGWAYVSSCGSYCYHVSCVMDIINDNWRYGFEAGKSDPFRSVKEKFPEDMAKRQQLVRGSKKELPTGRKMRIVLSLIFNVLTGNPAGLIGDAATYYRK